MKNTLITILVVVIIAVIGIFAYNGPMKKDSSGFPVVALTNDSNLKTASLAVGQKLTVTLELPAAGGYHFDNPEYDTSLIHLDSRSGNIWNFTALREGATDLTITASRSDNAEDKIDLFTTALAIEE